MFKSVFWEFVIKLKEVFEFIYLFRGVLKYTLIFEVCFKVKCFFLRVFCCLFIKSEKGIFDIVVVF